LPMEEYRYSFADLEQPFSILLTSRGCPFNCIFCLKAMAPGRYVTRKPEAIIAEIRLLLEKFKIHSIFFQDWEFAIDKERVKRICQLILDNNLKFKWGCNARANDLDENLVQMMKKAGCVRINIGFESAAEKILENIKKGTKKEDLEETIKICQKNGIKLGLYGLLNAPGENKKTIWQTMSFLDKYGIKSVFFNKPIPYFGTELFRRLKTGKRENLSWNNLEKYAGRTEVKQSPRAARFWQVFFKTVLKLKNKWHHKI